MSKSFFGTDMKLLNKKYLGCGSCVAGLAAAPHRLRRRPAPQACGGRSGWKPPQDPRSLRRRRRRRSLRRIMIVKPPLFRRSLRRVRRRRRVRRKIISRKPPLLPPQAAAVPPQAYQKIFKIINCEPITYIILLKILTSSFIWIKLLN